MERIDNYKNIVKNIVETLSKRVPINRPTLKKNLIINQDNSEFILILNGWHDNKHYYNIIGHIEIKDDKILIHEESIDPSFYERLTDMDVPESDIIPTYLQKTGLA